VGGQEKNYIAERRYVRKDGRTIWCNFNVVIVQNRTGNVVNIVGIAEDITLQKKLEQERNRLLEREIVSRDRAMFLAEAAKTLASSLDYQSTLRNVLQLMLSRGSSWGLLGIFKGDHENGLSGESGIHFECTVSKTEKDTLAKEFEKRINEKLVTEALSKVFMSGYPLLFPEKKGEPISTQTVVSLVLRVNDPTIMEMVQDLGVSSVMFAPILIRNNVLGGLMFVSSDPDRLFGPDDLSLACDFARICGVSIDNSILYESARRSVQVRDNFISIASHELRTPLTPLKLQVQLIRSQLQMPERLSNPSYLKLFKELLDDAETQVDRLSKLVENLLDVSRITTNRLPLSLELVDFGDLVTSVVKRFSPQLSALKIDLKLNATPGIVGFLDRSRMEQVVINLLTNAMKYGLGRPIEVSVEKVGKNMVLTVTDHGIGIRKEDQKKIFGRFERFVSMRSFGGLGLGLYISLQIIELHEGKIEVSSRFSEGSQFVVTIPIKSEEVKKSA
jgi:signal transduction histidine kinase